MQKCDLLVIGTGPAGLKAAIQAAKLGKKVIITERKEVVGGVCINTGTIPSKTLREAVLYLTGYGLHNLYGNSYTVKSDVTMADLQLRTHHVIQREIDVIRDQMRRNGVIMMGGETSFTGPHTLLVKGLTATSEVEADKVVIAVGTRPAQPPGVATDGETVLTSDDLLQLQALPRTMTVVGAGVIGTEYASMFGLLGVRVTLIDKRPILLDFVDDQIVEALMYQMRNTGCTFRLGEDVSELRVEGKNQAVAQLKSGKVIRSDVLLYSAGRAGATEALNLAAAGLAADERGRINVNAHYQTDVPHIYAAGDVIGFPALASTSMEQGRLASCHAFGHAATSMPDLFPFGIYSVPEISMVGKTEEELTAAGVPYEVGVAHYREIARGVILGDEQGLLKLLFHRETHRLLGVHIIGTAATELVHIGQAVLAFNGTLDHLVATVFNYPTLAECYKVAALDGLNRVGGPLRAEPHPGDVAADAPPPPA